MSRERESVHGVAQRAELARAATGDTARGATQPGRMPHPHGSASPPGAAGQASAAPAALDPATAAGREAVRELTQLLDHEARALDDLHRAQQQSRLAFVTRHATELQSALQALQPVAERMQGLEQRRHEITVRLGLRNAPASALLPRVPPDLRPALVATVERARQAAHRVRVESAVGERLLDFAGRAHEAMLQALARGSEVRAYDRYARAVVQDRSGSAGGGLLSGKV